MCQKISASLSTLRRIKHFLPFHVRKIYYFAYILPLFDYCSTMWGNARGQLFSKIKRLHKSAALLVLNTQGQWLSYKQALKKLNWLTLEERIKYRTLLLLYKSVNKMAPTYMQEMFEYVRHKHSVNSRSAACNNLYVAKPRTQFMKNAFSYSGAILWNSLPSSVKESPCLSSFKRKCASYLVSLRVES